MTTYTFAVVSGGTTAVLSYVDGYGSPRIFEGASGFYLYRMSARLKKSVDGVTWSDVGNGTTPLAMCQDTVTTPAKTLIFASNGTSYYHVVPESSGSWTSTGSTPSGLRAADAVSDAQGSVGAIVGNAHSGTESRIVKTALVAPYTFVDSDAGIPQSSGSVGVITDLELSE